MADNLTIRDGNGAGAVMATKDLAGVHYSKTIAHDPLGAALIGRKPAADSLPVAAADFGAIANPSASFTRPADTTAYATGDLVANSTAAGSVAPLAWTAARVAAGSFMVRRAKLKKSGASIANAQFRVHLYAAAPAPANGDNGPWSTPESGYVGSIDVTADRVFSDGAAGFGVVDPAIAVALASGQTIHGLVEARAAYAPANGETFTVTLEIQQN